MEARPEILQSIHEHGNPLGRTRSQVRTTNPARQHQSFPAGIRKEWTPCDVRGVFEIFAARAARAIPE